MEFEPEENNNSSFSDNYDLRIIKYIVDTYLTPLDRDIVNLIWLEKTEQQIGDIFGLTHEVIHYRKIKAFKEIRRLYENPAEAKRLRLNYKSKFSQLSAKCFVRENHERWIKSYFERAGQNYD